jgi:hypothetical protein
MLATDPRTVTNNTRVEPAAETSTELGKPSIKIAGKHVLHELKHLRPLFDETLPKALDHFRINRPLTRAYVNLDPQRMIICMLLPSEQTRQIILKRVASCSEALVVKANKVPRYGSLQRPSALALG